MRTTLDLDPDVLVAAKELAKRQQKSAGQLVSELLREALNANGKPERSTGDAPEECCGFAPFSSRGGLVTNKTIDELRDDLGS